MSRKLQRLVEELEAIRRNPSPENEDKARELSCRIAEAIPKKVLRQALVHPLEIRSQLHSVDINPTHPMRL